MNDPFAFLEDSAVDAPVATAESSEPYYHVPDPGTPGPLFFDLETVPDLSREHLFGLDPLPEPLPITPDKHMMPASQFLSPTLKEMGELLKGKNPSDAWIESVRAAEKASKKPRAGVFTLLDSLRSGAGDLDALKAERCKRMSVTPEFCRIVAIGFAWPGVDPQAILCRTIEDERGGLAALWDAIANVRGPVCGFNIVGFDLPVILVRSVILGVTPRKYFGDLKPWDRDKAIDLMIARFPRSGSMKLKDLARFYGIDVPAGDTNGSHVADLLQHDPGKLVEYVKSDVEITRRLHGLWKGTFV